MDLNIHFWRKDKEMTNKHKKIAQHHWFFKEMQFKTRMRFDHTIVRMATIKNQMIKRVIMVGKMRGAYTLVKV